MRQIKTVHKLQQQIIKWQSQGETIGFVPTMGALHEGHLSLIRQSVGQNDHTVLSIFVNPTQFSAGEDLDKYPRQLALDLKMALSAGADLAFTPQSDSFYGLNHQTWVVNPELENLYCGAYRPGHFRGVLTVVAKLFFAALPHVAYFGKKDYQQAFLIQKMVHDFNWPIKIKLVATSREASGLARSSRNAYLSETERAKASVIWQSLKSARAKIQQGEAHAALIKKEIISAIQKAGGQVQYVEICSRQTLLPCAKIQKTKAAILIAAFFGSTRLIDNIEV
jgi:pantoate--beta-alanine ligase